MKLGIVTGSGTYALSGLTDAEQTAAHTEYGTVDLVNGRLGDVEIVHVSRHGTGHHRLSNQVNHRANIAALRDSDIDGILAATVCGGLDADGAIGEVLIFDDLHFLTNRLADGSICTMHSEAGKPGRGHWIFDSPFSTALRGALLAGAGDAAVSARDGGCYGHVDGPRFNTRAEIRTLQHAGVTAVSQTAGPECVLAGEVEIPYALVGYVTDHANGVSKAAVSVTDLTAAMQASSPTLSSVLTAAIARAAELKLEPVGSHYRFN